MYSKISLQPFKFLDKSKVEDIASKLATLSFNSIYVWHCEDTNKKKSNTITK